MPLLTEPIPTPPNIGSMTPEQIASYYAGESQKREEAIINNARAAVDAARNNSTEPSANPPTPNQPGPSVQITKEAFWNDPQDAVNRLLQQYGVTNLTKVGNAAQSTLVESAKQLARSSNQIDARHWDKYLSEIEQLMNSLSLEQQVDANMWKTAYSTVIGVHIRDIEAAAKLSLQTPTEGASGTPILPPTPRELKPVERQVIEGLGISEDTFRKAEQNMANGVWPLTMDNRRK